MLTMHHPYLNFRFIHVIVENIEDLDLSFNNLRHIRSADLRPASRLKTLNLSHNRLRALPTLSLFHLEKLDASHNLINNIIDQNFDGMYLHNIVTRTITYKS